jgi:hypothetical protein
MPDDLPADDAVPSQGTEKFPPIDPPDDAELSPDSSESSEAAEAPPAAAAAPPVEVVVNLNTGGGPPSSGAHAAVVDKNGDPTDKDDIEAKIKLIEARRPFWDRLITSGLLPIALLVVGPAATWYFANRANEGLTEVKRSNEEVHDLKEVVETLSGTLQRADRRLREMEEERAAELRAMHALSERLDRTVQSALVQMAVFRLMDDRRVGMGIRGPGGIVPMDPSLPPSRSEVVRRVTEQVALPGLDTGEVILLAGDAYDRILTGELAERRRRVGAQPTMPDIPEVQPANPR